MTLFLVAQAFASSHREAPAIALDPSADITDFYAFLNPNDTSKVVFLMNVNPLENPGGGPNFHRFDDNVRYNIKCDNEGDGLEDVTFRFDFTTTYTMPETFLYNVGAIDVPANVNHTQTYTVTQIIDGTSFKVVRAGNPGTVAPINVGEASTPDGAYEPTSTAGGTLTETHIRTTAGGIRTFAGPRQESFFVDLERTFDLLNLNHADNTNTLLGYNVHTMAIEVPVQTLTKDNLAPSVAGENDVIACWSTTERQAHTVRRPDGTQNNGGTWQQVSRLGSPLVNEAVIPIEAKDTFSASQPADDIQFLSYVQEPLLPVYMELLLGIPNPGPYDAGLGLGGREDLILAFLTGHPALGTLPGSYSLGGPIPGTNGKTFGAFEALRMNLTSAASGYPNGRAVGDDVVDVSLSALAGLLINGATASDGVGSAGITVLDDFPFLGDPWSGNAHPQNYHETTP
jgi:hypothetical protein